MIMSGNEAWNRTVYRRWRKVDSDGADIALSGRLFQVVGPATGKARSPTVGCLTDGTNTSDMQIVTECQSVFNFRLPSAIIPDRCETFRAKYDSCSNSLVKLALSPL